MAGKKRRAAVDGGSQSKKARMGASLDDDPASPPSSTVFTEPASVAETSMTSRSSRPKRYICEQEGCDKAFDRPVRLEAHVRTHTGDRPFICQELGCDKNFFKSEHLKAHVQNKHAVSADYVCTHVLQIDENGAELACGKAFTTGTRLRRHVAAHEGKEETTCKEPGCGQVFRKMETLQRHVLKDHMNEKAYRCAHALSTGEDGSEGDLGEVCGQTFSSIGQLKRHENREHSGLQYFCEFCTASNDDEQGHAVGFRTYAELQAHHKDAHPPTCNLCEKSFPSDRALTAHLEIEHSSLASRQKFKCDYPGCERGFTRQGNLKVHYQTVHVKSRTFACGQYDLGASKHVPGWDGHGCGLGFGTKAALENHVRTQHLQLPSLSGRRKKIKSEDVSEVGTPIDFEDLPDANIGHTAGTLSLLTGQGYEDQRPLECWEGGCAVRFSRDYDLGQHMEVAHGWTVEQINDRFVEQQALSGESFWIGGEIDGLAGPDPSDEALRTQLEHALRINAQGPAGSGLGEFLGMSDKHAAALKDGEMLPAIREDDSITVDPALM